MPVAAALGSEPADAAEADSWLARAAALAESAPDTSSAKAEYHYRHLQAARLRNDAAARRMHAGWLIEHARGSTFELAGLIEVARDVERRLEAASEAERAALQDEAYTIYARLVSQLGDSPKVLQAQTNARVALTRLAEYAYATGRYDEAADRLQRLLAYDPKDRNYLRLAGLTNFQAKQYNAALNHWRTLTHGLPRGSEEWFEAKYYQLACLAETDSSQARKALANFRLYYPNDGPPAWQEKFAALSQRLKS